MKRFLFPALLAFAFVACEDDDDDAIVPDTTAPVITVEEPVEDEEFQRGSELHIEGTIVDNKALAQMKIDVHYAGDGHGHGGKTSNEFEFEKVITISGQTWSFHEHVDIPTDADTGLHHLIIYAIDAAGNQAEFVEKDFIVTE